MAKTARLGITKPVSEQDSNKVVTYNTGFDDLDAAVAGYLIVNVAGNTNVTLTRTQATNKTLEFTGALTGNIIVFIPATEAGTEFNLYNNTTGAFSLTVKTTAGGSTGPAITQTKRVKVVHNGTNVNAWQAEV